MTRLALYLAATGDHDQSRELLELVGDQESAYAKMAMRIIDER